MDPTCGLIGNEFIAEVINFDVELGLGKGALLFRVNEAASNSTMPIICSILSVSSNSPSGPSN